MANRIRALVLGLAIVALTVSPVSSREVLAGSLAGVRSVADASPADVAKGPALFASSAAAKAGGDVQISGGNASPLRQAKSAVSAPAATTPVGTVSVGDGYLIVEYDSIADFHQGEYFRSGVILGDLQKVVDPGTYDFVLLYTLSEVPGFVHSGAFGKGFEAKNIGIGVPNPAMPPDLYFPDWTRLRSAPHMNSVDIHTGPMYGGMLSSVFYAMHEMGHVWNVRWAPTAPANSPMQWTSANPVAWLAIDPGHWSWLFVPDADAGIMRIAAPQSEYFNEFDLYAMGLKTFEEVASKKYRVKEAPSASAPVHEFGIDDLLYALSLGGPAYFIGDGHRDPPTDPSMQNVNALFVIVKQRSETMTPSQNELMKATVAQMPQAWNVATQGRSVLSTPIVYSPTTNDTGKTGISGLWTQLAATVIAQGANLASTHLAPLFDPAYRNDGVGGDIKAKQLAADLRGATLGSLVIQDVTFLSYDPANQVVSIKGQATVEGETFTVDGETDSEYFVFRSVDGGVNWRFFGNQRIASTEFWVEMALLESMNSTVGPAQRLDFGPTAPLGTVSSISVSGPGLPIPRVLKSCWAEIESVEGEPGVVTAVKTDHFCGEFFPTTTIQTGSTYQFAVTRTDAAGGGTETYSATFQGVAVTDTVGGAIRITQPTGFTMADAKPGTPLLVTWTLPTAYPIAYVDLWGRVSISGNVRCDVEGPNLGATATAATITLPFTCNSEPITRAEILVSTGGANGENSFTAHSFSGTAPPPPTAELSVAVSGPGSVSSNPSGIACGTNCSANYVVGTSVTLTATPSAGSFFSGWGGACSAAGSCAVTMNAAKSVTATFVTNAPGGGTVAANPYGALTVEGGSLIGNTISNLQPNATIQLGPNAGAAGSYAEIDLQGLNLAPGAALTIRSGAPGQTVVLVNNDAMGSTIGGTLQAQAGNISGLLQALADTGASAPAVVLRSTTGITIAPSGAVVAPAGLTLDALGTIWTAGRDVVNAGTIDGGASLAVYGANIKGGGAFRGDAVVLATRGNANNPVNGAHFLANGLQLYPSHGSDVALTLNHFGNVPQVLNVMVNGNASVRMPSAWPDDVTLPPNNRPVLPGSSRPAGMPAPAYGAGSMIVQASGSLVLAGGLTDDFVFPGGIVLKSGGTLDLKGVVVSNGWTTSGKSFQGVFFESPYIVSSTGNIQVFTNDLNWVNFSTFPHSPVRAWQLINAAGSGDRFQPADTVAPHLNAYSLLIEAAAAGQCWVCLVNNAPVNMQ